MLTYLTARPAYGRSYSTRLSVLKDFTDGKDFKMTPGPYFSIRDKRYLVEDGVLGVILPSEEGTVTYNF
jgi:hypothetical protein